MTFLDKLFGKKKEKKGKALSDFDKNYFLGKELGKGAFAVVKEATRKTDSKKFAAKIIDKTKVKGNVL